MLLTFLTLLMLGSPDSATFPPVTGENLNGREVHLPSDFDGDRNLVLIAFHRDQQKSVDTWAKFADSLLVRDSTFRWYEIPTLGRRYKIIRGIIDGGMRGGIPDTAARTRTITLYIDKSPFRKAMGLGTEDSIYAVLVDREGKVYWRATGVHTPAKAAELEKVLGLAKEP